MSCRLKGLVMEVQTKHISSKGLGTAMDHIWPYGNLDNTEVPMSDTPAETTVAQCGERRSTIIAKYLTVLENCPMSVARESSLPYSKKTIRHAIIEELRENPAGELRNSLEVAYVQLETFLPWDEYRLLRGFKFACAITREVARSGKPRDIIALARLLDRDEGKRAVEIQESISEQMRRRQQEISSIP